MAVMLCIIADFLTIILVTMLTEFYLFRIRKQLFTCILCSLLLHSKAALAVRQVTCMKLTKTWILDAAAQLFTRDGYEKTTTRAIAELAGVSESTLFRNYKTKEALLNDLLFIMTPGPEDIPMDELTDGEDLEQDFLILLAANARLHIRHLPVFRLSMHLDHIYDQARFSKIQGMVDAIASYLEGLFQEGKVRSMDYYMLSEEMNALALVKANEFVCAQHYGISTDSAVSRFAQKYAAYYADLVRK